MKVKYYENIVKYLPVLTVCLLIGILGRIHFINKGADEFTVNVIFIIFTGFGISIYAIFGLFFNELIELFFKIFPKKKISTISEKYTSSNENLEILKEDNKIIDENNRILEMNSRALIDNEATLEDNHQSIETDDQIIKAELSNNFSDLEIIRIRAKGREEELIQEKLELIVQYTKEKLAPYASDEDLYKLCDYLIVFLRDGKIENVNPIKITVLSTTDLMHFGWNVWNHYRGNNKRIDVAKFLKTVFSQSFREIEETKTIEKLLTSRSKEGLIIIEKNLLQ